MSADWISLDEYLAKRTPEQREAIERARQDLHIWMQTEAGKRATPDERMFFDAMAQPIRTDIPRPADPLPWHDDEESDDE